MKKILSFALAAIMLVTMSIVPSAASGTSCSAEKSGSFGVNNKLDWHYFSDGLLVIDGEGDTGDFYFDATPWRENSPITSIIINEGVTRIGDSIFRLTGDLETVTIPKSLKNIGSQAFRDTTIKQSFYNGTFEDLLNIEFEGSYSNPIALAKEAFIDDVNFERDSIVIPNTITEIKNYAFAQYENLESIYIPECIETIGSHAFFDCPNLKAISVDIQNQFYTTDTYGVLFNKDETDLIAFPAGLEIEEYKIPNCVTKISEAAFSDVKLNSLIIPNSVTHFEGWTFSSTIVKNLYYEGTIEDWCNIIFDDNIGCRPGHNNLYINNKLIDCNSLLEIPSSVTEIKDNAFRNVDIGHLRINEGTICIGSEAFSGNSIEVVEFPKSLRKIKDYAFYDAEISTIIYAGSKEQWENIEGTEQFARFDYNIGENIYPEIIYLETFDGSIEFTEDTLNNNIVENKILELGVKSDKIKKVIIGENVTSIESGAFSALSSLEEVDFYAENCKIAKDIFNLNNPIKLNILGNASIKAQTFKNTDANIEKIYIDTTGYVYASAFMGTSTLKEVEIINAKGIYAYAFAECPNIEKVVVKSNGTVYANAFELTEDKALGTLEFYPNGAAKTFDNTNFKNVIISGEKNESISLNAFSDCKYLESVVIRNNIKTIFDGSFANCPLLKDVFYFGTSEEWSEVKNLNKLLTDAFVVCEDEILKTIRGSATLDKAKFTVKMAEGKTVTGFYRKANTNAIEKIRLYVENGDVQFRDNDFVAYRTSNAINPNGVLSVSYVTGETRLYEIVFDLGCIDIISELRPIRGSAYLKDQDVVIKMADGKNATGIYATTNSGYTVTFENIEGSFDKRTDAFVAYTTSNRANVKGKMIVTTPDGEVFKYNTIFDIDLGEGSFVPVLDIRPIRGSVKLNDDGAVVINMANGKDATGFYTTTKNGYKLELKDAKGTFADRKDAYVAYASKNYYNPEATLVVTAPDGTTTEYPVIFEVGLGNIGSIQKYDPATDLRAIRSNITRNTDGTIVITRLDSLTKSQGNGIYTTTKSGATVTIKEAGTFANRTDAYVAYLSQNDKNIESTMIITFPDGLTETYPVLFDLGYDMSSSTEAEKQYHTFSYCGGKGQLYTSPDYLTSMNCTNIKSVETYTSSANIATIQYYCGGECESCSACRTTIEFPVEKYNATLILNECKGFYENGTIVVPSSSAKILVKIWGEGEDNDADNVVISVEAGTYVNEDKLEELLMETYGYDVMADAFDVTVEAGNTYTAQVINIGEPIEKNIEVQLCNTTNGLYESLYYAQGELISNETIVEKLSEMYPNADWTQLTINGTINAIAAPNCTYSVSITTPPMSIL